MSTTTSKVPMGQKIAFGLGMLANQMFPAALQIFMVVLVQDYGFSTFLWGILFFLPRLFDSFTDPIMGFISDNTRSVWGRRRQYVLLGAVIMGVAFAIMWQMYVEDGVDYNFTYFLIWSLVFYLGLTIFSVPYVAMGYEMSDDFHERTNIMAIAQSIGQWAWVIAPWFWVVMYDDGWFGTTTETTRTLGIWVAVFCALLAMVPAVFIKSKSTKDDSSLTPLTTKTIGGSLKQILNNFVEAFKISAFRKLCFSTFLIFNAFNVVAGFSFFIVVYYLFNGDAAAAGLWPTLLGSVGALATTFLVIPIVAKMSKSFGKKKAFLISQGISVLGYIMLWFLFIPGKPYMFLFALPFFSFGIGGLFTIMMSMTSDIIDIDELNTGKRREGVFGAIYWLMVKFGFAFAGLATGAIMALVGFVPDTVNTEASITGIRLFYSGLPIVGTLAAMWIMRNYNHTEEKALEISAELAKRKIKKKTKEISSAYGAGHLLSILNSDIKLDAYSEINFENKSLEEVKDLFSNKLNNRLCGLCFSPYVEGQSPDEDILSESQIRRRMEIIAPYTVAIRSFSCTEGNELIPKVAHDKGLNSIAGAWISADKERNIREINALIELAKTGVVNVAAVGNEVLLRGDVSEEELIGYINQVKQALKGLDVSVGYVDTYYEYYNRPKLVEATDIILANCYPFWEGFSIEDSLQHLREMYAITKHVSKGKKVIIAETGWPSQGAANEDAHPSQINAMKYFIQTQEWAKKEGVEIFHFSSFDETWKVRVEGELGARWGIWDKDEKLKYK